jgi:4-amino-4-deoxy-L-arabinose transferase-like glycosyltransferase
MKLKFSRKLIISSVLVWLVILLGVFLRSFRADSFPIDNNDDGLFYVWAGNSFLDNPAAPISHSIFDKNNPWLIWRSQFMDYIPIERFGFKIVQPWFDHPPLATVLVALPARLLGYRQWEQIPHLIVRYPAIIASIFTMLFTYLLAKKLMGKVKAKWGLLFLATVPYFVLAHRQSFIENFLTPLFLLALLYLIKLVEYGRRKDLLILMPLAFLTGWFKISGFSIPFMIAAWLWYKKKIKFGWCLAVTGAISILSYLAYGLMAQPQAFLQTILNQGVRGAFVSSFFFGLTRPEFYGEFNDGWYILGFLFSFLLLWQYKKNDKIKFFGWFFLGWLIVLFMTAGRLSNSPWYRYPLIPFMAMAIGYYVDELMKKNSIFLVAPLFLLGLTGFDLLNIEINSSLLRWLSLGFFTVYALDFVWPKNIFKRARFWLTRMFVVSLVILNIFVSLKYSTSHCSRQRCLTPQKIILDNE